MRRPHIISLMPSSLIAYYSSRLLSMVIQQKGKALLSVVKWIMMALGSLIYLGWNRIKNGSYLEEATTHPRP